MRNYLMEVVDRAVKSAAQAALLALGADTVDLISTDWLGVVSLSAGGFVLSVLTSVASAGIRGKVQVIGDSALEHDLDAYAEAMMGEDEQW